MSFGVDVKPGDLVPVSLQLEDGATDKHPTARIVDETGTTLTTLSLGHLVDGLYIPSAPYLMPSNTFIRAIYIVYNEVTHLTEDTTYGRDVDVFVKEPLPPNVQLLSDFTASISEPDDLSASIEENNDLKGDIEC